MPSEAYSFLNLPPELRLIVCAYILPSTTRRTIASHHSTDSATIHSATVTQITYTLATSILRTNKLIHTEARPILAKQLERLKVKPIRFEVRFTSPISHDSTHSIDTLLHLLTNTLSHRPTSPLPYPIEIALDTAHTPYWTIDDFRASGRLHRVAYTLEAAILVQFHGAVPAVQITPAMRLAGITMFEANRIYRMAAEGVEGAPERWMKVEGLTGEEWEARKLRWEGGVQ